MTQKWPEVAIISQDEHQGDVDWGSNEREFPGSFYNMLEIEVICRCTEPYGNWSQFTVKIDTKQGDDWDTKYLDRIYFCVLPEDHTRHEKIRKYELYAPSHFTDEEVELEFAITVYIVMPGIVSIRYYVSHIQ